MTDSPSLQNLLDGYADPAVIIDLNYRIVVANHAYRQRYGNFGAGQMPRCYEASHHYHQPCDQAGETCPLKNSLQTGQPQRVLHLHFTSLGEEHVDVETLPIRDNHGQISFFLELLHKSEVMQATRGQEQALIGRSLAFTQMMNMVQRVAASNTTVLLLGESGTGKELVARSVHENSQRATGPFVAVDCSGLTESLFESELFGHEKGAFTGALQRKIGLVEAARGGTLFLDELGDIPLALQVKLLRLLETSSFRRVGGVEPIQADFRLVCATHRDLHAMVQEKRFRQDLYYRISTFPIELPALRDRHEDIPLLCEALLHRINAQQPKTLQSDALAALMRYAFPGNIRELRNILERAWLLADGDLITANHLPSILTERMHTRATPFGDVIVTLGQLEKDYLSWAQRRHRGDKRSLAKLLGMSERTLYRKLQTLGLKTD